MGKAGQRAAVPAPAPAIGESGGVEDFGRAAGTAPPGRSVPRQFNQAAC